ncbi:MAG: hypothetical protein KTR27_04440 [Leptolyngbyaceae cyanobacterium MAG.088]|nr:hypothetical protein [Leptolyngbyaceae cyanobacterium MAG.088]
MFALNLDSSSTADTLEADVLNIANVPTGFDFQVLNPLEMVTNQFSGVSFACAIALIPSNPRFTAQSDQCVIMPTGNDNHLSIALDDTVDAVCLWGRCTQPMVLKVVESTGKVLKIPSETALRWPDGSETALLPLQILRLENMSKITMIELSANAPYTVEGLSV